MKKVYLFITILSTFFLTACSNDDEAKNNRPATIVHTENVHVGDMPINLHAVGSVKADKTVHLQSRTPGELLEILVKDGDIVNEGQVLFRIDKAPLEAALAGANASYRSNRAQLTKAKDDLDRILQLSKSGFASDDQQEQAKMRVDMLSAALKADDANIKNARLNLSYADIKAPIAGKIGAINTDVGNYISPGQPILTTLEDTSSMKIDFAIPESELVSLRESFKRGTIPVQATTGSNIVVEGVLTFLGNVNPATGTIQVTARFDNKDNALWVGQFVDVLITTDILKDVNIVSEKAVTLGPNGLFVYVINDNIAELRLIESHIEESGRRVVSSGLNGNEKIVVDGHVRLFDGAQVEIANASHTNAPTSNTKPPAKESRITNGILSDIPTTDVFDVVKPTQDIPTENTIEEMPLIENPVEDIPQIIEEIIQEEPKIDIVEEIIKEEPEINIFEEQIKKEEVEDAHVFEAELTAPSTNEVTLPEETSSPSLENNTSTIIESKIEENSVLIKDLAPIMMEEIPTSTELPLESLNSFETFMTTEEPQMPQVNDGLDIPLIFEETSKLEEISPSLENLEEKIVATNTAINTENNITHMQEEKQNSITKPISGAIDLSTKAVFGGQSYFAPFPQTTNTGK